MYHSSSAMWDEKFEEKLTEYIRALACISFGKSVIVPKEIVRKNIQDEFFGSVRAFFWGLGE